MQMVFTMQSKLTMNKSRKLEIFRKLKFPTSTKAQAPEKVLYAFMGTGVYIVMFIALAWFFGSFVLSPVTTHEDAYLLIYKQRFLDSPDCFAYQDKETGNVYPGIIDKAKFTKETLNNCYGENKQSNYEFQLRIDNEAPIETENYGFPQKIIDPIFVLIYNNDTIEKGMLNIRVQGVKT